jgi:uncharacterized membrane protein
MRNRSVGFILLGVSALIGFMIYSFNRALTDIVAAACSHGSSCPMWGTIDFQTNVSMATTLVLVVIGLYMILFGDEDGRGGSRSPGGPGSAETRPSMKDYDDSVKDLNKDARDVLSEVVSSGGTIFQSEIAEKTGLSKVRVTRSLDRLEGKGIIERKRRGMTNVVILRH